MQILKKQQIVTMEECAVENGISLSSLMDRAGAAVAEEACEMVEQNASIVILCGKGNNGGDGFVCSRLLSEQGMHVTVILALGEPETEIAGTACKAMGKTVAVLQAEAWKECNTALSEANLIIDAIFGFSFHGKLWGNPERLIQAANQKNTKRLAVDLPSGVECDTAAVWSNAFLADQTVTFHALKPANVSYPGRAYCGKTKVRDLGISQLLPKETPIIATDMEFAKNHMPIQKANGNKGDFGKLLMLCGSYGMAGACVLAARAALRSGVGLLYLLLDRRIYSVVSACVPEAVCIPVDLENQLEVDEQIRKTLSICNACVVGCGLGKARETVCKTVLSYCEVPLLVDADGINYLAEHPETCRDLPKETVLTPHPGELSRLIRHDIATIQDNRLEITLQTAKKQKLVLLLKGAGTVIAEPSGRVAINTTGNQGMAKGGSGDALSGIIGALMAQGVKPYEAAVAGAYIHGAAGDRCAAHMSKRGMLPSDLILTLPEIYREYET